MSSYVSAVQSFGCRCVDACDMDIMSMWMYARYECVVNGDDTVDSDVNVMFICSRPKCVYNNMIHLTDESQMTM